MQKTDEYLINRLTWKAEQYKLPTKFAFYFKDLSPDSQQYLNNQIDKRISGAPVLFFTKPTKEWTLICTRQVICNDNKNIIRINIADIKALKPTVFEKTIKEELTELNISNKKAEWHKVTVVDTKQNNFVLHADKGNDLFSLWTILLMVSRLHN